MEVAGNAVNVSTGHVESRQRANDDVNHVIRTWQAGTIRAYLSFDLTAREQNRSVTSCQSKLLVNRTPQNQVHEPQFILQGNEHDATRRPGCCRQITTPATLTQSPFLRCASSLELSTALPFSFFRIWHIG